MIAPRPLYITGNESCQVIWENPALKVNRPGKACEWFPLTRISRIAVIGAVEWEMAALLACAQAGISICFFDHHGTLHARWLGVRNERESLIQRLADALTRPDGPARYADWRNGIEHMAARSAARRLGLNEWQTVEPCVLRQQFYRYSTPSQRQFRAAWRALLLSEVTAQLMQLGLDGRSDWLQHTPVDIANDCCTILAWDYETSIMRCSDINPALQHVVQCFQADYPHTERLIRGLFNKLHRWLVEMF